MTYYSIEIRNTITGQTYRYTNCRNLGTARLMAQRFSQGYRIADVVDQNTGAVMATYEEGEPTYMDLDPYAGY